MQPAVFGFDNFGTATYKDGVLYAPSKGDDNVYAINASNGDIIWNRTVRQCDASSCIDGEVIYVAECFGPNKEPTHLPRAIALNKSTGEVIWQFIQPDNYPWVGSPLVHEDYVYYTTYGSGVYALNKTNGDTIWHQNIGELVCSVAYHDGVVFVSAYEPSGQYAFNATTGEELWHTVELHNGLLQDLSYCSPAAAGEAIYYQSLNGTFYLINETDGGILWSYPLEGHGFGSPSIGDGRVFITNDSALYAFRIGPGSGDWPMFCQNKFHRSFSEHGIEYVKQPLTWRQDFKDASNSE